MEPVGIELPTGNFPVSSNAACAIALKRTFLKPCGLLPTAAVILGVPVS